MLSLALISLLPLLAKAQYTATYTPGSLPDKTEPPGQIGTNNCGTASSQTSLCQNVYINSVDDFCLWGPPAVPGSADWQKLSVGHIEEIAVSYCLKDGYGTRLIPSGTITSAHFVKVVSDTVSYVQVTGSGDIGLMPNDDGGELDVTWTGLGNPQGGLVFTNAFSGQFEQLHEWTSFPSSGQFCIKGCRDGPNAPGWCEHIYDVLGCGFTIPGSFDPGFDNCLGSPAEQPGVYGGSTFHQGDPSTPAGHPAGPTSQCTQFSTIGGGSANLAVSTVISSSSSASNSSASGSSSMTSSGSSSASITSSMSGPSRSGSASGSGSATAAPSGSASVSAASAGASSSRSSGEKAVLLNAGSMVGVVMGIMGAIVGGVAVFA